MQVHQLVAASRLRDGTSLVDEAITPVDGDLDKVVAADKSDDGGRYVKNSMFTNGRPIRTEHMPTVWRRSRILERGPIGSRPADRARFCHETEGKAMNSGPMPGEVYGFVYAHRLRSGKALHDEAFEPLDGDWAKVQIADLTDDGGAMPLGPEINIGRRVDPTHMPTAFRYKAPRHQGLRDVMPFLRGTTLVSPAFRDLVERFEPGVHQFLPVAIWRKDVPLGDMFVMVIAARIDGLNHDLCEPPREGRRIYRRQIGKPDRIVFDAERIAGHHLWYEKHLGYFYLSGALAAACEASGLEGIAYGTPIEVSHL